jgi:hypothetical protein
MNTISYTVMKVKYHRRENEKYNPPKAAGIKFVTGEGGKSLWSRL